MAKEKKQFTELSDEELKQVTGGASIDCSLPENKDNIICNAKFKRPTVTFQGETLGVVVDQARMEKGMPQL